MTTPEAAFGLRGDKRSAGPFAVTLSPVKGATLADRQSRIRCVCLPRLSFAECMA